MTDSLLRIKEVKKKTGLSITTIYRYIRKGAFPKGLKIGPRMTVWPESEVARWIEERKAEPPLGQSE